MINVTLIGAGRIGIMHAKNLLDNVNCNLNYVFDINNEFAKKVSDLTGAKIAETPEEAINDSNTDVVFIASATDTHTKFIIEAAKAGKAIFCEKPIDLSIDKVNECYNAIKDFKVPIQIGFNRRFDPSNKSLKMQKDNGAIGILEMIIITSRDPAPPPLDYLKVSGGLMRDCSIHDFDLARFILDDDPIVEISANASQLVNDDIKSINDHDTAMIIMKSKNGILVHINNSRRAVYGYDQRVEVFGSKGMLISNNQTPTSVEKYNNTGTALKDPIHNFFIERYHQAYKDQLDDFIDCVINKEKTKVNFEDGRRALILADAAYESLSKSATIKVNYE